MDLLTPRFPDSALLLHTQKQCTARRFFYHCFWPLNVPGST